MGRNVVLDGVQHTVDVVLLAEIQVQIINHELDAQVAGGTAHAQKAGVHRDVPAHQVLVQKALGQAEALGHVLVQVQAEGDVPGEVVVHQADDAVQVLLVHAAEGIDDGKGKGVELVHLLYQPEHALV